jgi:cytochrome P450
LISIAGGETTAHTLSSAVYYLLKTPESKRRLFDEVRSRYTDFDEIDATSALQLPYLRAVINEALRIHPSGAQGFPRVSPGMTVHGLYVPPGVRYLIDTLFQTHQAEKIYQTEIYTSAWAVTHDPRNFEDPNKFRPERWLDPSCTDVKEASQPFSLGSRACVGRKLVDPSKLVTTITSHIIILTDLAL